MSIHRKNYEETSDTADWLNDQINPNANGPLLKPKNKRKSKLPISRYDMFRYSLLGVLLIMTLFYIGENNRVPSLSEGVINTFSGVDDDLIDRMGTWMAEMGYGELSREELMELRNAGVTATFTSRMRDLGYNDLTLDDLKRLRQAGVTETFAGMMQELGYKELTKSDLILLKQRGLTADFTAKVQNLGFPDVTIDELIRLKNYNVTLDFIERAKRDLGENVTIDEIIRYRIRNQ